MILSPLAFDCAHNNALGQVLLQERVDDHNGQYTYNSQRHTDTGAGQETMPLPTIAAALPLERNWMLFIMRTKSSEYRNIPGHPHSKGH